MDRTAEEGVASFHFVLDMASVTITKQQDKNAACMLGTPAYPHSPLRYPGGKSRAVKRIVPLIPPDTKCLCSPFVGGASVELACATMGMDIRGYDIFTPLVNFWQCLLADPQELAERVKIYHPMGKVRFYELQKRYMQLSDNIECAAVFYALNRSSFSGTTLSGGMSPHCPRFNTNAIERLRQFAVKNITITQADYRESISDNADAFLYLDPPHILMGKNYTA